MSSLAICLMGPTASGKTDLALQLAERFPLEIISVDSVMVYRGLDIGTAKPSIEVRRQTPHHVVDIRDPAQSYSAAEFRTDALQLISTIRQQNKVPLLVGGTMLYFRALLQGLSALPEACPEVRQQLDAELKSQGLDALYRRLLEVDPAAAERIHANDPQRILRALEVYRLAGEPMSTIIDRDKGSAINMQTLKLGLYPQQRSQLHERIADRFRLMLAQGFVDEVAALKKRNELDLNKPSMRAVGYRQVWHYLDGEYDYEAMTERGIIATRQLAKRQLTWLRAESNLLPLEMFQYELNDVVGRINRFLN